MFVESLWEVCLLQSSTVWKTWELLLRVRVVRLDLDQTQIFPQRRFLIFHASVNWGRCGPWFQMTSSAPDGHVWLFSSGRRWTYIFMWVNVMRIYSEWERTPCSDRKPHGQVQEKTWGPWFSDGWKLLSPGWTPTLLPLFDLEQTCYFVCAKTDVGGRALWVL